MDENEVLEQEPVVEEEQVEEVEEQVEAEETPAEADELEKSVVAMVAKVRQLAKEGKYGTEALQEVQPLFNQLGETVKKSVAAPAGHIDEDALAERITQKVMEKLPDVVAKSIAGLVPAPTQEQKAPVNQFVPRSLTGVAPQVHVAQESEKKLTQIERIARRNSGLSVD